MVEEPVVEEPANGESVVGPDMRVAFVTCEEQPEITSDDASMVSELAPEVVLETLVWGGEKSTWVGFDLLVLRSCWDYHLRCDEFLGWLFEVEGSGTRVLNEPSLVAWNSKKTYLRELSRQGCEVVPTEWLEAHTLRAQGAEAVRACLDANGWSRAVLKPMVSASGLHTWTTGPDEIHDQSEQLEQAARHGDLMLQPFLPEIEAHGEWSIVFFGGEFSHSVLKRAKPGDFRVQSNFGGSSVCLVAPDGVVSDARRVLEALPSQPVYARIDGIERDERLVLIEAELIEPQLFLRLAAEAPGRFARALHDAL